MNLGTMLALVGTGFGVGFSVAAQVESMHRPDDLRDGRIGREMTNEHGRHS